MNIRKKFEILTYNIGFITKGIDKVMEHGVSKNDIIWMKHPYKDRFFADPFLFNSDGEFYYILCEEYFFWEEKGKITMLKVDKKSFSLKERKIVIEEKTHLSFPLCAYGGDTVLPESSASDKYVAYKINRNTFEVISKKTVLEEGTIDAVIYKLDGNTWLLTGKKKIPSTELYLYKKNDNGQFISCSDSPVISDNRHARSAGNLFMWQNKLYRPVQDCAGRYGRQTKIMEVIELGDNLYSAKEYKTINSFENPPFNETMHTFNVYNECILVDGSKDMLRFPMKFFYKKCKFIFQNKSKRGN